MSSNVPDRIREVLSAHRALAILRLLNGNLHGLANDQLLYSLMAAWGLRMPRSELEALLEFLDRTGAISIQSAEMLTVVELKRKGQEIAEGLIKVDGIEPPGPECPY